MTDAIDKALAYCEKLAEAGKPGDREAGDLFLLATGWRRESTPDGKFPRNRLRWIAPAGQYANSCPNPPSNLQDAVDAVPDGWRVFIEHLPIKKGMGKSWTACIRPHGQDGYDSDWCETPALALAIAILKALKAEVK